MSNLEHSLVNLVVPSSEYDKRGFGSCLLASFVDNMSPSRGFWISTDSGYLITGIHTIAWQFSSVMYPLLASDPSQAFISGVQNTIVSRRMSIALPISDDRLVDHKIAGQETLKRSFGTQVYNNERVLNVLAWTLKIAFSEYRSSKLIDYFKDLIKDKTILVSELELSIVLSWYKYPDIFVKIEAIRLLKDLVQKCGGPVDDMNKITYEEDHDKSDEAISIANWTLILLEKAGSRSIIPEEIITLARDRIILWVFSIWGAAHLSQLPFAIQASLKRSVSEDADVLKSLQTAAHLSSNHGSPVSTSKLHCNEPNDVAKNVSDDSRALKSLRPTASSSSNHGTSLFVSKLRSDATLLELKDLRKERLPESKPRSNCPPNERIFGEPGRGLPRFFSGTPPAAGFPKPPSPTGSGNQQDGVRLSGGGNERLGNRTHGLSPLFSQDGEQYQTAMANYYQFMRWWTLLAEQYVELFMSKHAKDQTEQNCLKQRGMQKINKVFCKVIDDKDKFSVEVDACEYKRDEIKVNVVDRQLVIEGHHKECTDEHGRAEWHFIRKYELPREAKVEGISYQINDAGVISITTRKHETHQHGKKRKKRSSRSRHHWTENSKMLSKRRSEPWNETID